MGSIPGSGRSPGGGQGSPLRYSCLGNSVNRGTWWTTVHRVAKSGLSLKMNSQWTVIEYDCLRHFIGSTRTGFPGGTVEKNLPAKAGDARDADAVPESGRSPGGGHGHPLLYSCLDNSLAREAGQPAVRGVTESRTQLSS